MFELPSHKTKTANHALADGDQHDSDDVIKASDTMETEHKDANPGMALAITTQPTGRTSIASFPDDNGDGAGQHMTLAPDNGGSEYKDDITPARPVHQVNQVNLVKPWATNQQQLQSKDDTEACTFKSIILSMILPNIPNTSQNEHLSIQCGGGNDPQVYSWSKPTIPCSSGCKYCLLH